MCPWKTVGLLAPSSTLPAICVQRIAGRLPKNLTTWSSSAPGSSAAREPGVVCLVCEPCGLSGLRVGATHELVVVLTVSREWCAPRAGIGAALGPGLSREWCCQRAWNGAARELEVVRPASREWCGPQAGSGAARELGPGVVRPASRECCCPRAWSVAAREHTREWCGPRAGSGAARELGVVRLASRER